MKPIEEVCMTLYMTLLKSTQGAPKTKAELREMLAEAVRNTQQETKPPPKAKPRTYRERP
jgi:hypothetical protein